MFNIISVQENENWNRKKPLQTQQWKMLTALNADQSVKQLEFWHATGESVNQYNHVVELLGGFLQSWT